MQHIQLTCKQLSESSDTARLHFVLRQSNIPLILEIPKLFTFPHPALSRENTSNSEGDAENKVL